MDKIINALQSKLVGAGFKTHDAMKVVESLKHTTKTPEDFLDRVWEIGAILTEFQSEKQEML